MTENNKIYITASELADMLGVSVGHAYKLIRKLNKLDDVCEITKPWMTE